MTKNAIESKSKIWMFLNNCYLWIQIIKQSGMELTINRVSEAYPYELLLLADETVESIHKYLFNSQVYVAISLDIEEPVGVFCLYKINVDTVELKNIAVAETYQRNGIGSSLIGRAIKIAEEKGYKEMIVGTGDCGTKQIRFYEKNGFVKYGIRKNFFLDNFDTPIYEDGVMLKDMVMLKKTVR